MEGACQLRREYRGTLKRPGRAADEAARRRPDTSQGPLVMLLLIYGPCVSEAVGLTGRDITQRSAHAFDLPGSVIGEWSSTSELARSYPRLIEARAEA
jgi:hypothetical protein